MRGMFSDDDITSGRRRAGYQQHRITQQYAHCAAHLVIYDEISPTNDAASLQPGERGVPHYRY